MTAEYVLFYTYHTNKYVSAACRTLLALGGTGGGGGGGRRGGGSGRRGTLVSEALRHDAVRRVHVALELLVHAERGCTHGALVREMGWFECDAVLFGHVCEQLPLVHLQPTEWLHTYWTGQTT